MLASVKVGDSVQQGLNSLIGFIPNIMGFLLILAIGYFVAKLVETALGSVATGARHAFEG